MCVGGSVGELWGPCICLLSLSWGIISFMEGWGLLFGNGWEDISGV